MTGRLTIKGGAEVLLPYLTSLGEIRAGDVFYLTADPGTVWYRGETGMDQEFCCLGNDTWFTWHVLGNLGQTALVIHNTKENST